MSIHLPAPLRPKRLWLYALLTLALALAAIFDAAPTKTASAAAPAPSEISFTVDASDQQIGTFVLRWTGKNVSRFVIMRLNNETILFEKLFETSEEGTYLDQGLQLNRNYQYRMEAYDASNNLVYHFQWSRNLMHLFATPDVANRTVHLNWTSMGEDVTYVLLTQKSLGDGYFTGVLPPLEVSDLSADVTGLNLDEEYVFRVSGYRASTGEVISGGFTNRVYITLYSQPFQLRAAEGAMQVALDWDALPNTKEYIVQRATSSGGPYTTVSPSNITGTSFNDYTAQYGMTYYYIVTAMSNTGKARQSNEVVARPHPPYELSVQYMAADTQDDTMLPYFKIVNSRSLPVDLSTLTIRYWYTQDSAAQDHVFCYWAKVGCANTPAVIKAASSPSPTANAYLEVAFLPAAGVILPGDTSGDIRMQVTNAEFSNYNKSNDYSFNGSQTSFADYPKVTLYENGKLVWGIEPGPDLPTPPQNLIAVAYNEQVLLNWDRSIGATRYTVKRATNPSGPFTIISPYELTQTTFMDTTAQNGRTYYYLVTASNNGGESAPSQVVSATPNQGEPNQPQSLASVSAQYRAGDNNPTNNTINPYISLKNTGDSPVALSDLQVRYYFTVDGDTPQNFVCDWAQVGCANVQGQLVKLPVAKSGADYYVEFTFDAAAGTLAPGASSGDIQSRIHKTNWGNYNETGDYSYEGNRPTLTDMNKITVYQNDALIWGIEP